MGTIYKQGKLSIRVNGDDHPPIHAHVTTTTGNAMVYLGGKVKNSGVSPADLELARVWILANEWQVRLEWSRCNGGIKHEPS